MATSHQKRYCVGGKSMMITATVRKAETELGVFGKITSKQLIPYIGKEVVFEISKSIVETDTETVTEKIKEMKL